jgi:hypothetical protein
MMERKQIFLHCSVQIRSSCKQRTFSISLNLPITPSLIKSGLAVISSLSLTQTSFCIIGRNFKKSENRADLARELSSSPYTFRYLRHVHFPLTSNSLLNSSQAQITSTITSNQAAAIMLWPLDLSGSAAVLYTSRQLLNWNIMDGGSNSLTGIPTQAGYIEDSFWTPSP